jgi:predicted phosphodiesterase
MTDIHRRLTEVLGGPYTRAFELDVGTAHRFIVFSDQHKGAGDQADEFRKCQGAYAAALRYYRERGFTLILLGDVEELWEQNFGEVEKAYREILALEGSFGAGRYLRVWGNHDDQWMDAKAVSKRLAPYMPPGEVLEGLRFDVRHGGRGLGRIFLVHGHQGEFGSEHLRGIARVVLKVYRIWQRLTGLGTTTPAKDACLRGEHDRTMYQWAAGQDRLMLIAGHTHRPVWSSRTHLEKLQDQLRALEARPASPERDRLIREKQDEIEKRRARMGDCNDVPKPRKCYFNAGCCRYDDGDITGMELEDGVLRLLKWSATPPGGSSARMVLEEDLVEAILTGLAAATTPDA